MFKVVIIDDEPSVVEGLSRVIKWERYGCEVVGTASDGREGLEVISRSHPDIIISDIAVPGMDGLEMIAATRLECPDAMITILTGYRNFDYARAAINLGVCRFLLKPSNPSQVEEAVRYMADVLKRMNFAQTEPKPAQDKLAQEEEKPAQDKPAQKEEKPDGEPETEEESQSTAGSFIVKNALDYLNEHYDEKVTLGELADKMYVSQWHLSKLMNRHTKKTFSEVLNEIRVREAKKLLGDYTLRVGDVAEMVGFLDIAHFSRVFKKYTGMSANEYRNKKLG